MRVGTRSEVQHGIQEGAVSAQTNITASRST
jgi:hypothetical protein